MHCSLPAPIHPFICSLSAGKLSPSVVAFMWGLGCDGAVAVLWFTVGLIAPSQENRQRDLLDLHSVPLWLIRLETIFGWADSSRRHPWGNLCCEVLMWVAVRLAPVSFKAASSWASRQHLVPGGRRQGGPMPCARPVSARQLGAPFNTQISVAQHWTRQDIVGCLRPILIHPAPVCSPFGFTVTSSLTRSWGANGRHLPSTRRGMEKLACACLAAGPVRQ